jgi:hypothetical protein
LLWLAAGAGGACRLSPTPACSTPCGTGCFGGWTLSTLLHGLWFLLLFLLLLLLLLLFLFLLLLF